MQQINSKVSLSLQGDIAVILSDNPPVNALGLEVRAGVLEALHLSLADTAIRAIVVACSGKTFFAGADITEFGRPRQTPLLQELIADIESSPKPVIAAIHGTALGGGLEIALGAHFRVALPTAQLGLPEIKLGLIPGAGGTQRLSRLIGPIETLKVCLSGEKLSAANSLRLGILDQVSEGEPAAAGLAFARHVLSHNLAAVPVRDRAEKIAPFKASPAPFDVEAAVAMKRHQGQEAPQACVESVRRSFTLPMEEALRLDTKAFSKLVAGTQSKARRHLFFAQRETAKITGLPTDVTPRPINRAVIIGAGTMGGGIAMCFAGAGIPVTIVDTTTEACAAGLERVRGNYVASVKRGSITQADMDGRLALISGTTDRGLASEADLVIEAVFEELSIKAEIFADLSRRVAPGIILATNTSALDIDAIASATDRPQDVVGMHFFAPANIMRLLEVVRGKASSPAAIATAISIGKTIGKVPVLSGNCDGFIGNRMLAKRSVQVDALLLEGALPTDIDGAIKAFGFPMGPLETNDMSGLDIGWSIRKRRGTPFAIADAICEKRWFGQKTGRGYYIYEKNSRAPMPNPDVQALIIAKSAEKGVARRSITRQELIERMIYPLVNEGARILEDSIAQRAADIDVVWTTGYGFPAWRGGPMFYADTIGLNTVVDRLEFFAAQTKNPDLSPSTLLRTLADRSLTFAAWDKERSIAD